MQSVVLVRTGQPLPGRCPAAPRLAPLHLGTGITAGNLDVDLSYGLSWLHAGEQQRFGGGTQPTFWDLFSGTNGSNVPTLVIPGVELGSLQSSSVNAGGRWHFDENQSLDLNAAFGRIQLEVPGNVGVAESQSGRAERRRAQRTVSAAWSSATCSDRRICSTAASTGAVWISAFPGVRRGAAFSVSARKTCGLRAICRRWSSRPRASRT